MATLDSNSKNKAEEEEEEDIYQFIFTMNSPYDMEEEGKVSSSSENTPVYQKIDDGGSPHAVETGTTKRLDMDALDINLGIPVLRVNVESLEEKPWRKIGADTSDYFNYGFDEESWKVYCKKHAKNKRANAKKARTKIMVPSSYQKALLSPAGVSSAIPGSKASSTKMIDTAKASECHIKQDMEDRGDKDSDRYKEYDHDHKDSKRGRDKERQSCSSSHNSSSSSSRSRRDDGEDRDSQSIHKHKKAKRNRKDKESNEMFSAD
ncbi:hypothetical protein PAMA_001704 [Pampus argenteus]